MSTVKPKHIGRNISRIRELRDMKQEALAIAIGTNQQSISIIEGSESVDEEKLKKIAEALGVSAETIKNFSEDAVFNIIGNTIEIENNTGSSVISYGCTFNPLDKLIESIEKNEKLYERLIQIEREKAAYLEKLLDKK
ncbi:helix-turn-helix domain-containing protein [Flavobacterium johnsoniae]|uniref:Transcriptional regulator, XRE family n=1 Tax=Flavobacterium johnsoniae (strain ATCC 17061 / DSM 2064 / JCM 8514 / BCRC 14874 / CCUG 350202 / NBRC 14942 / NCIMB 11054 / UW101) TaxID=376686 RepID=A5FM45_FLAJ1|nr:helix-turn-helix transcriptional regulator [Flavobacterium johnsoniae]ABQ03721.1 transcriptional regulator, XRE family [Flavobacterium johnsoniae UW101]OXG03244.1 transcriptional regulator [Flavobacterium johnsoniae UW101]WQG79416.1 helix-turn-helix transcriptional regulator [Flavobacterium johnsoniae UW101]SHK00743.1 DNA-binding transcriptional regulator, XRE-family HTH domain [Flavobacterium johnsoniae]